MAAVWLHDLIYHTVDDYLFFVRHTVGGCFTHRDVGAHTHFLLSDVFFLFHSTPLHKAKEKGEQKTGG